MTERWRPVPGWDCYEVSDQGRVRSLPRRSTRQSYPGQMLRLMPHPHGYRYVNLCQAPRRRYALVHVLVLEAFVGLRPDWARHTRHDDGDPTNNALANLRWGTPGQNARDRVRHGTHSNTCKPRCPRGHPLVEPNLVRSEAARGGRDCLACSRARGYLQRHPEADFSAEADRYYAAIGPVHDYLAGAIG